ncbi:MAG: macrolide ABC transporter ATP-binding protein [Sulfobacillus acidophilus]|uniref:Macrolide ABC transporter ATP-binding protein n=1 Tax=Sulfobacillus acidophilus TaxID=53633 RepID=A0A2T2WIE5_9FIRM|nr:MAG: macrolide ABC transporter ATP-binding protein [Sulfobacillus acidophilus]
MAVERIEDAPQIELKDIARSYGEGEATVHALRGVSLTIRAGEMVALMGPSGSGKSSLMNILGLFDRATSGTYTLNGQDMTRLNSRQQALMRGRKIAFVFQGIHLLPRLNALSNVELPMQYARIPSARRREAALRALQLLGVEPLQKRYPSQMSGGQAQRVAIARAIAPDPDVLLADEPTGALDRKSGELVLGAFQALHDQTGVTVIIVTHDPFVAQHAERIISLEDGQIVDDQLVANRLMVSQPLSSGGHA